MTETHICCHCGQTITGTPIWMSGDALCEHCAEEETMLCSHCGERIYRNDNAGDEDTPLCQSCYDRSYLTCDHCGRIIHEEDAYYASNDEERDYPLCYACRNMRNKNNTIQDYYFKPEPLFRGDGLRYFGVELEIDGAGEYDDNARELMEIANKAGTENLYCKHDGSLDEGFELVTHPMTLEYHLNICCPYTIAASAAKSSVRSAIRSPLTAMLAAFQGKPEAAVGYTPAVWSTK